jgi:hypothetical protein
MRGAFSGLAATVVVALFGLTGCVFGPDEPEEVPAPSVVSKQYPEYWPGSYDLDDIDISGTDFVCEPATDWAKDWVTGHYTRSGYQPHEFPPPLPDDYFVMVEIGDGENPGQTWWVVAVRSYTKKGNRDDLYLLTDSEQWIILGAGQEKIDWSLVSTWAGQRLLHGLQAHKKALTCLNHPYIPKKFDGVCHSLDTSAARDMNASRIGELWQVYHSAGRPYSLPTKVEAVSAGGGYWVFAATVYGETSAWLAWGDVDGDSSNDVYPNGTAGSENAPLGPFVFPHWGEITSLESWDGGPAPHGPEALELALQCVK